MRGPEGRVFSMAESVRSSTLPSLSVRDIPVLLPCMGQAIPFEEDSCATWPQIQYQAGRHANLLMEGICGLVQVLPSDRQHRDTMGNIEQCLALKQAAATQQRCSYSNAVPHHQSKYFKQMHTAWP